MKRRSDDIAKNVDVSCELCVEQRKVGHPRPSCEECGKVILSSDNSFVWEVYCRYFSLLTTVSGMGSVAIKLDGARMVCQEMQIADVIEFASRIAVILAILNHREREEEEESGE